MSFLKVLYLLLVVFVSAKMSNIYAASEAVTSGAETNPLPVFRVTLRDRPVLDGDPMYYALMCVGTNKFHFLMPTGFRLDASDPKRVVLTKDACCFLMVRLLEPMPQDSSGWQPEVSREELLQRRPNATIVSEFSATAAGRTGSGFELRWKNSGGGQEAEQIAFIPSSAGILEFSVRASANAATEASNFFRSFLQGFCAGEILQAELRPFSAAN